MKVPDMPAHDMPRHGSPPCLTNPADFDVSTTGGPTIWSLLRRATDRVAAAVLAQPSGSRPEMRDLFYEGKMKGLELIERWADISMGRWSTNC